MLLRLIDGTLANTWKPGIGDPTLVGWVTVLAYFATAAPCILCALLVNAKTRSSYRRKLKVFWWCIAGIILALGFNKQLDLQSLLTVIGRHLTKEWGWYDYRRELQKIFLILLGGSSLLFAYVITVRLRDIWSHHKLVIAGLMCLMLFVFGRASSFHHIDQLINFKFLGLRVNWVLELGGIFCIAIASTVKLYQLLLERKHTL